MRKSKSQAFASVLILLIFLNSNATSQNFPQFDNERNFSLTNIQTDTLFNSRQVIHFLTIPDTSLKRLKIEFVSNGTQLLKTSSVAELHHALAAINGSFFDMDSGGSVCYFELNDSVVSRTKSAGKWAIPDSLANGAVVLTKDSQLEIESAKTEEFYEKSKQESAVLVSGPLLIRNSQLMKLPDMPFSKKRYPRTFLCLTRNAVLFIAVDGRSTIAEGMSLYEAQEFLQSVGCVDAINLDGGGSTTLWTKDNGLVNHPSDKTGERRVADEILIIEQ